MAKVKKLQVRTPQTTDGKTLAYTKDEKVIYKTSIVELAAKKDFENLNAKLPSHLKHKLEEIEVETDSKVSAISKTENTKQDDATLKAKEDEITSLKQKLADVKTKPIAAFVISKIEEAATLEEVNELIEGDDRATVIKAANKKIELLKAE